MKTSASTIMPPKREKDYILSIIIPLYNKEEYIETLLFSLHKQTCRNIEIIVVDDGSTDRSGYICERVAQIYDNIVVFHTKNKGTLLARKIGILNSTGKYIMFVDPDDYLSTDSSLEYIINLMKKLNADIVQFSYETIDAQSRRRKYIQINRKYNNAYSIAYDCFVERFFTHNLCFKIFKGEFVRYITKKYVEDLNLRSAEDLYMCFIFMYFAKKFYCVSSQPIYTYRVGVGISSGVSISYQQYLHVANDRLVVKYISDFLIIMHDRRRYKNILCKIECVLIEYSCSSLLRLPTQIRAKGLSYLTKNIDKKILMISLWKVFSWRTDAFYEIIKNKQLSARVSCFKKLCIFVDNLNVYSLFFLNHISEFFKYRNVEYCIISENSYKITKIIPNKKIIYIPSKFNIERLDIISELLKNNFDAILFTDFHTQIFLFDQFFINTFFFKGCFLLDFAFSADHIKAEEDFFHNFARKFIYPVSTIVFSPIENNILQNLCINSVLMMQHCYANHKRKSLDANGKYILCFDDTKSIYNTTNILFSIINTIKNTIPNIKLVIVGDRRVGGDNFKGLEKNICIVSNESAASKLFRNAKIVLSTNSICFDSFLIYNCIRFAKPLVEIKDNIYEFIGNNKFSTSNNDLMIASYFIINLFRNEDEYIKSRKLAQNYSTYKSSTQKIYNLKNNSKYQKYIYNLDRCFNDKIKKINMLEHLLVYETLRVDVWISGDVGNDVILKKASPDPYKLKIKPPWLKNGLCIYSSNKILNIDIVCIGDGVCCIEILSLNGVNRLNERYPIFIDCTKFVVNSKIIFDTPKTVWHDRRYIWKKEVNKNESLNIYLEFDSCKSPNVIRYISAIEDENKKLKEINKRFAKSIFKIKKSYSYTIGRVCTWLPRMLYNFFVFFQKLILQKTR